MKTIILAVTLLISTWGMALEPPPAITLPDSDWSLAVKINDFELAEDEVRSDGRARLMFFRHKNARTGLTVVIKPAEPGFNAVAYRDSRWEHLSSIPPKEIEERLWSEGAQAYFEYFTEVPFKDDVIQQKHVHTFLIYKETRFEIHVSMAYFDEKDRAWLAEFQKSILVVANGG